MSKTSYYGSCHCGRVRLSAEIDLTAGASRCNCTVCTKTAWLNAIIKPAAFALITGEPDLASYAWGGKTATRYFCRHCGVQCFARGFLEQVGGDYVGVNVCCLDGVEVDEVPVRYWDGRHNNWQAGPQATPWRISA